MEECFIHCDRVLPADHQSTEVAQPGKGALNLPTPCITPHLAAIVVFPLLVTTAIRADHIDPSTGHSLTHRIAVITLIRNQSIGIMERVAAWKERREENSEKVPQS